MNSPNTLKRLLTGSRIGTALAGIGIWAVLLSPGALAQQTSLADFMGFQQAVAAGRAAGKSSVEARAASRQQWARDAEVLASGEAYLPEFIIGGEWTTTLTITNLGTETAQNLTGYLVDNNGFPLTATINGEGSVVIDDAFILNVDPGVVFEIQFSLGDGQGYGHIYLPPVMCGSADCAIQAQVALKNSNPTRPDFESVFYLSAPETDQAMLYDHRGGFSTTLYLVNAKQNATTVRLTMQDDLGNVIGTQDIDMAAEATQLITLHAMFPDSIGHYGLLIVKDMGNPENLGGILTTAVRINPTNSFTPLQATRIPQ